jgi:rhodanese-related sulfurtransferase
VAVGLKEMVAEEAKGRVGEISPDELQRALESGEDVLVIDVREPHEFAQGHLPGAVNVPRGMLELKADAAPSVADPVLARSGTAAS